MTTTDGPAGSGRGWDVVLPVKGGPRAKSRLEATGVDGRAALARALALDTVATACACRAPAGPVGRVLVVTGDEPSAHEHAALGAVVVTDPGGGLDAAVRAGVAACDPDSPCAVLLADLPSLRPEDLSSALVRCRLLLADGAQQVVVPDASGTGTTMLAARRPADLRPAFGPSSAHRHRALGAVTLDDAPWGLRHDVDTAGDLATVLAHGTGARTTAEAAVVPVPAAGAAPAAGRPSAPGDGRSAQARSTMAPSADSFSEKCS